MKRTLDEIPIMRFRDRRQWKDWLEKNHDSSSGLWLRLAKKGSARQSISYAEALEVALCYGWIDAQKKPESDDAWLQKFSPRSKQSIWSKINRGKALALIDSGHMQPAGLEQIARAKKDGRWEAAYDSPSTASVPADFQIALDANPRARKFFEALDRANRYAFLFRVQTPKKPETRRKRIEQFIHMLDNGEKLHP